MLNIQKSRKVTHIFPSRTLKIPLQAARRSQAPIAATSMLTLTPTNFRKTPNNLHKRHDLSNSSVNVNLFQNRKI